MTKLTKAWAFAALAYDENKFVDHVFDLFGLRAHVMHDKTFSYFAGVIPDEKENTLYIFNRGTDGANWIGNFESWARNFRVLTGGDGVHNGFQDLGNKVIDKFKEYIYRYDNIVISGQSQGAGVTPYEACLITENFRNVDHVHGFSFAAPPTGNKLFAQRCQGHIKNGAMTLKRYNNHGDPIDSEFLRGGFLDAVDVGEEITLPRIIRFESTMSLRLIQHSNAVTNAALMQLYAMSGMANDELVMLGRIGERVVN
jgi:hypothetical protein